MLLILPRRSPRGPARLPARLPGGVLPGAASLRRDSLRLQGAERHARAPRAGPGARRDVRRARRPADRRRAHLPRRHGAARLRTRRPASTRAWRSCIASCRSPCWKSRNLAASVIGLGLLLLARALFRRVQAAYSLSVALLVCGVAASLLKGLRYEEAIVLALVLAVLALGRRAFYRPTSILDERFTPAWVASIAGVITRLRLDRPARLSQRAVFR